MSYVIHGTPYLLLLAYLVVGLDYGFIFFTGHTWARRSLAAALPFVLILHFLYLVVLTVHWGQFPAANVSQSLSVVAFAISLIYVFLEWLGRDRATGFWMLTQVVLFQALAVALHGPLPPHREIFEHPLFGIHVFLALIGYASFALAASYAFLFLRLYKELKRGRFTVFYGKLPSLEVLERMMTGALIVGFLAFSGAVLDGALWLAQLGHRNWLHDPMILFTLLTWALYAGALLLKRLRRWQGRQTAMASLTGLAIILVSLLAVRVFLSGFHRPL